MNLTVYHGLPFGGAKRVMFEQIKRLHLRHTLKVVTLGGKDDNALNYKPYVTQSISVSFKPSRLFRSPLGRLNQGIRMFDLIRLAVHSKKLAHQIDQVKPDIVLVHPCQYTGAPWILHYINSPTLYFCHEHNRLVYERELVSPRIVRSKSRRIFDRIDLLDALYFQLLKWIEERGVHRSNWMLVNSKYIQGEISRIYNRKAMINYPGVDVETFTDLKLQRSEYILSVGVLNQAKGFDLIIKGLSRLPEHSRPPLILVSNRQDPVERSYLDLLATQVGVKVAFLKNIDEVSLVRLYNQAMMTVYTPIREPFGLVPLESMACGTPVIGIAEGGINETIVPGITGLLVQREPNDLADSIAMLIQDAPLREKMGNAGRAHVMENWTWDHSVSILEEHLSEVEALR